LLVPGRSRIQARAAHQPRWNARVVRKYLVRLTHSMGSSRLQSSTAKVSLAEGSVADVPNARASGSGSARAPRGSTGVHRDGLPVPDRPGRREPVPPEAAGAVSRTAGKARPGVGRNTPRAGPAGPVLRLARGAGHRPAGNAPPLAPAGVPPSLALAISAWAPTPPGGSPAPDRHDGAEQFDVG
jgi:hypothetical protein